MATNISLHQVASVTVSETERITHNNASQHQFFARDICITFMDGTTQVIALYSDIEHALAVGVPA